MVNATLNIEKARLFLTTPYVTNLEVTLLVDNWKEWSVVDKRDVLAGTVKETTFPFRFVKQARKELKRCFDDYLANAKATLTLWKTWNGNVPTVSRVYDIDFGTYMLDDEFVEVACRNQDLRSIIKQNENTEYSIPLSTVALDKQFKYERVELDNKLVMRHVDFNHNGFAAGPTGQIGIATYMGCWLGFTFGGADTPVKDYVTYSDADTTEYNYVSTPHPSPNLPAPITVTREADYKVTWVSEASTFGVTLLFLTQSDFTSYMQKANSTFKCRFKLIAHNTENNTSRVLNVSTRTCQFESEIQRGLPYGNGHKALWTYSHVKYDTPLLTFNGRLYKGESLRVYVEVGNGANGLGGVTGHVTLQTNIFASVSRLELEYSARHPEAVELNCTDVRTLLKSLYVKAGALNCNVSLLTADPLIHYLKFIPSSHLTDEQDPQIYVSHNKVTALLKQLGHTLVYAGDTVYVRPIIGTAGVFNPSETPSFTFTEAECADLVETPYVDMTFNEIRIGNTGAENLEGVNAHKEFNRAHTYTSNANSKNKLDLTSSIRTDSVGFETAVNQRNVRGRKNTSKELYVVVAVEDVNDYKYKALPTYVNGLLSTSLNGALAPQNLIRMWMPFWSGFTDTLKLSGYEGAKQNVDGLATSSVSIYDGNPAVTPAMLPVTYDLATSDNKELLVRNWVSGVVQFTYKGQEYKGFILEAQEQPLLRNQKEIKLIAVGRSGLKYNVDVLRDIDEITVNASAQNVILDCAITGFNPENYQWTARTSEGQWSDVMEAGWVDSEFRFIVTLGENASTLPRYTDVRVDTPTGEVRVVRITQKGRSTNPLSVPTIELSGNGEFTENNVVVSRGYRISQPTYVEQLRNLHTDNIFLYDYGKLQLILSFETLSSTGDLVVRVYGKHVIPLTYGQVTFIDVIVEIDGLPVTITVKFIADL